MVEKRSRNPLKSGQCFLRRWLDIRRSFKIGGRNPLKSGQCFLHGAKWWHQTTVVMSVAIPSNRVNVSYNETVEGFGIDKMVRVAIPSNRVNVSYADLDVVEEVPVEGKSQSPQIGSMFLTVVLPDNRNRQVLERGSQSPQIGSMFLTWSYIY